MADPVLALELLFEDVKARLAAEAPDLVVDFGWRSKTKQLNQGSARAARVVFEPGVERKAGSYVGARRPGRNPRPLRTLMETCTVYCWAFDGDAPNDELAQWRAARLLHDFVVRAIELALRKASIANLTAAPFSDPAWVGENVERTFGAELRFVITVESSIPDEGYDETIGATASIANWLRTTADGVDSITGDLS